MVELKRKVTLKAKDSTSKHLKKRKWALWIVLIVVIIIPVILGITLGKPNEHKNHANNTPAKIETAETTTTKESSQQNANPVSDQETAIAEEQTAQKEITPAASTLSTTNVVAYQDNVKNMPVENLEQKALQVIRGDFGNGKEQKMKLGAEYSTIQAKVNEMYKKRSNI